MPDACGALLLQRAYCDERSAGGDDGGEGQDGPREQGQDEQDEQGGAHGTPQSEPRRLPAPLTRVKGACE